MNPSAWPQLDDFPALRKLMEVQLDMQFADLWALMRLPVDDVRPNVGCNLSTASHIFNLVSAASVLFYASSPEALAQRHNRGERFKKVFAGYYPWESQELAADEAAKALYAWARNPLTHSAGVGKDRRAFPGAPEVNDQPIAVMFSKGALTDEQVTHLATTRERNPALMPTVVLENGVLEVEVITLSWGVHELYRRLFEDEDQVARAEATARQLLGR